MNGQKKLIKTVAVFCGSKFGNDPQYRVDAERLGALLGQNGFNVVYGGGASGLMGVVARAALENGSIVRGHITHAFRNSNVYQKLEGAEEMVVRALHQRKAKMFKEADAIIILPGGIGTLDEKWEGAALLDMEMASRSAAFVTPIIVLNTKGYYDDTKSQMLKAIREGFIHPGREKLIRSVETPELVIERLHTWNETGMPRACDLCAEQPVVSEKSHNLAALAIAQ